MARVCSVSDIQNDPVAVIDMVVAEKAPVFIEQGAKASVIMIDADTYLNRMQALKEFERIYGETPTASLGDQEADAPKVAWRCKLCGYIVEMDELPDDFTCPLCGAGKDMFERIEL